MNLSTRGVLIRKQLRGRRCPPGSQTSWPAQSFEVGHSWSRQSEAPGRCFQTCRLKKEKLGLITGIIKWHHVYELVFQTEVETHKQLLLWLYVKMLHLLVCHLPLGCDVGILVNLNILTAVKSQQSTENLELMLDPDNVKQKESWWPIRCSH